MSCLWIAILLIGLYQHTSAKQCSSPGKFPQYQAGNCAGYALCLISGSDTFTQYNLTCPSGFIYNHIHSQCTNETGYYCVPNFNCSAVGHFPNPYSDNCTTFIACVDGHSDIMTARSLDCPLNYIFNPIEKFCVKSNETSFKCKKQESDSSAVLVHSLESTNSSAYIVTCPIILIYLMNLLLL